MSNQWDAYVSFPPHEPGNVHFGIPTTPDTSEEEVERKTLSVAQRLIRGCARYYRKRKDTPPLAYVAAWGIELLSHFLQNGDAQATP